MYTLILFAFLEATPGVHGVQVERIVAAEHIPTLELCQQKLREKAKDVKQRKWKHMGGKCVPEVKAGEGVYLLEDQYGALFYKHSIDGKWKRVPSIAIDSLSASSCQVGQSWHVTPDVQSRTPCVPREGR